jgi:hypothetical protein
MEDYKQGSSPGNTREHKRGQGERDAHQATREAQSMRRGALTSQSARWSCTDVKNSTLIVLIHQRPCVFTSSMCRKKESLRLQHLEDKVCQKKNSIQRGNSLPSQFAQTLYLWTLFHAILKRDAALNFLEKLNCWYSVKISSDIIN